MENLVSILYKEQRVVIKLVCKINAFWQVSKASYYLCNKKTIYIEFRVFWKGKEKREFEGVGDHGGLLPILGPLSQHNFYVVTEFLQPYVATGFLCRDKVLGRAHDTA